MFKYRVTNTSGARDAGAHARPIFLTEAGRLLQPGDAAPVNRLDKGTQQLVDAGELKVEEGAFPPYVPPKKKKPVEVDDDDDDRPKKAAAANEKVGFRDVQTGKNRKNDKVLPLRAAGAEDEDKEEPEILAASTDDDEDLGISAVTKADVVSKTGLPDLVDPTPKPVSAAVAGFHDNLHVGKSKN